MKETPVSTKEHRRYIELDSLRGLAALSVFFGHMYLMFNETSLGKLLFEYGPLRIFIAGSEAVTLFFVLSGFVLSLPYYSNKQLKYGAYITRRIIRIYIPYISAILIAVLLREMTYSGEILSLSNWFNNNWTQKFDLAALQNHSFLIGTFLSNINNVVWSLVHEMRISLVFPFIIMLLIRLNAVKGIGLALILSLVSIIYYLVTGSSFLGTEVYSSVHYSSIFILGALIAKNRNTIVEKITNISLKSKLVLFVLGLLLYLYVHPSFLLNIIFKGFDPYLRMVVDTWFTAIGSGILIIFALSSVRFSMILKNKVVNFIGKISYSLYLIHIPVLLACVHLLHEIIPIWGICLISIIGTFIFATVMYFLIEKSAISLGRFLTNLQIRRSRVINKSA